MLKGLQTGSDPTGFEFKLKGYEGASDLVGSRLRNLFLLELFGEPALLFVWS